MIEEMWERLEALTERVATLEREQEYRDQLAEQEYWSTYDPAAGY